MQKTYIPGYRIEWRRAELLTKGLGLIHQKANLQKIQIDPQRYIEMYSLKSFSVFSHSFQYLLTFRLKWIDLDPDLHHAGKYKCIQGSHTQPHTHTLFLIWPIKRCVFVKRDFFLYMVQTQTHKYPTGPVLGKAVTCKTYKQRDT